MPRAARSATTVRTADASAGCSCCRRFSDDGFIRPLGRKQRLGEPILPPFELRHLLELPGLQHAGRMVVELTIGEAPTPLANRLDEREGQRAVESPVNEG